MMCLSDLETMECDFLNAKQVAEVLKCDSQYIRIQAHEDPSALGFPVTVQGRRVRIPRLGFINWAKGYGCREMGEWEDEEDD